MVLSSATIATVLPSLPEAPSFTFVILNVLSIILAVFVGSSFSRTLTLKSNDSPVP